MVFHRKQKHVDEINVQINGTKIERVESFNFLGIMLDENLTWKSHIEMVGKKISKVTGILYQGPHSFSFFELKTFLKTFFTTLTTYCKKFAIFLRKLKIH